MKKTKGFTLIELMVTLAIISVAMLIAFPTFLEQREKGKLKSAGRDLIRNFQLARMNALKEGKGWGLEFVAASNSYKLVNTGEDNKWDTDDDVVVKTVTLADYGSIEFGSGYGMRPKATSGPDNGIVIGFNETRIPFSWGGESQNGTIYVKNAKTGDTLAVGTYNKTGRIKTWVNFGSGWDPSS